MIKLTKVLAAWGTPDFKQVLKAEIRNIDITLLPLQQGLSRTSYVSDEKIDVVILNVSDTENSICVKRVFSMPEPTPGVVVQTIRQRSVSRSNTAKFSSI